MAAPCSFPYCRSDAPPQLVDLPICARHAQEVYLAVHDLAQRVTLQDRIAVAPRGSGRAKPGWGMRPGVVYFMRFGYLIKIGFSANLKQRIKDLRPDEVLLTMPGTMQDEKALHERFRRLRERNELFLPGPELTDFIEARKAEAA